MSFRLPRRWTPNLLLCMFLLCLQSQMALSLVGQEDEKEEGLTLEKLFPEKSLFGPSASGAEFSADGRYGAYLYRPLNERRHGSDLWIYDFEKGESTRLTSVSVMAEFQEAARKVKEARIEQAKKEAKSKSDDEKSDSKKKEVELTEEQKNGDWVSDKDADDEEGPRYSGVSGFTWSPVSNELLFVSGSDLYRMSIEDSQPVRLTRTRESERAVSYLPDGSGYLFMQGSNLLRVKFDSHFIEQVDPKLPNGEQMSTYSLSPDGMKLAVITRKGDSPFTSDRTVNIVNYRGRFAEVEKVRRTTASDVKKEQEVSYYLYDLSGNQDESSELMKIHSTKLTGPRDLISTPEWAPDSSKVVFSTFHQDDEEVHIYLAEFPSAAEVEDKAEADSKKKDADKDEADKDKAGKKEQPKAAPAKLVYRFLHFGGPNTPGMVAPRFIYDSKRVALISEQSGFRHLHILDPLYESLHQVTSGYFEVYPQGLSKDRKWIFVTSTKEDPAREEIYRINLETNEIEKISQQPGVYNNVAVSNDGTRALANYITYGKLRELVRIDLKRSQKQKVLTDSHKEETRELTEPKPEFFSYENRHGHEIHGMMFKPDGWKKSDKRPLLIYVYGGPLGTRKMVVDGSYASDSYFFAYYMAKKHGYVTVTIDPRGLSGYGGVFEKANFEQIGKPQVEDLVDGVKFATENFGIDSEKVGIHGWSFGGFQTQMCMYTAPETFQVGIAGAGPTEWENYNAWYTTGTVGPSREDELDQKKFSLLPLAKNLEGKLLLVHGMEDSNVLYQDTVKVYRELLKAEKETLVELFLDPTGGHGLGGDVERIGRYRKYEEFLTRTLGGAAE